MRITAAHQWNIVFLLLPRSVLPFVSAYDVVPRWGQATAMVNEALFVFGGKIDEFNQFSYTSAPNCNEILLLSLSSPFDPSSPPWQVVGGSANQSTFQGPALAWSTLSAFNNTGLLLFGGQSGVNSPSSNATADLLDIYSRLQPNWTTQLTDTPPARMRHSSATASSGEVFIFGGEKLDGSNIAFSDHFYFDPNTLSFTPLPTQNALPDVYGHASIILPDGRILVFGGYCPSQGQHLPLSTIWIFDTTNLTWNVVAADNTSTPSPRVAFAAVLTSDGKVLIHGGSDSSFQTNFADGWILDPTQNPMTWTAVDALSQLGARRDHFAVSSTDEVIFGFGYGTNGPAPAALQVFNTTSDSFVSGYITPPLTANPTQTLPSPTQTQTETSPVSRPYSSTAGVHPTSTSTSNPENPDPGNGSSTEGGDGDGDGNSDSEKSSNTTAIAVGISFGVLSLIVIGLGAAYYVRRRRHDRDDDQFIALGADDIDDQDDPHFGGAIPVAGMTELDEPRGHHRLLSSLGIAGALATASRMRSVRGAGTQRRDMLADEDTRSLGEWYNSRRRDGTGGSSWSLLSILGGARLRRNASTKSHGTGGQPTPWREKTDPFSDGAAVVRDEETGFIGSAAVGVYGSRPHSRREMSYASSRSAASYRDPFVDPPREKEEQPFQPMDLYTDVDTESITQPPVRYVSALPPLRPVPPPLSQQEGHLLSPLSERTSQSTLAQNLSSAASSNAHSSENEYIPSPITAGTSATSRTSLSLLQTPGSAPSSGSLLGASSTTPTQPMRRSDSWWAKFARTSLRDRRSHDSPGYDIRDPTPAPKLSAIDEGSMRSAPTPSQRSSPGEADAVLPQAPPTAAKAKLMYAAAAHGKSASSVRTADSEAIERMAGTMDVALRVQSRASRWGSGSTSSHGGRSIDTQLSVSEVGDAHSRHGSVVEGGGADDLLFFASPLERDAGAPGLIPSPPPAQKRMRFAPLSPPPPAEASASSGSRVLDRIQAYERRMSQSEPISPPPTNSKHREERTKKRVEVDYGLVPRPSLFVANPDHRLSTRSDAS